MASALADASLSRTLVLDDVTRRQARQVRRSVGVEGPKWGSSNSLFFTIQLVPIEKVVYMNSE
jgi:hypothetical protein